MASIYVNENFPLQVVKALREKGHDLLTTQEAGQAGRSVADREVLAFAVANNRAVLTLNRRDFIRLHMQDPEHYGIIVCTQDPNTDRQAERIHQAIQDNEPLRRKLIRVNRPASG